MSNQTLTHTVTADTAEPVTAPFLPPADHAGDGYDWMETLVKLVLTGQGMVIW